MLVVNPTQIGQNLADRKPRVISEIRKANVQRSPSLDGHPKLSGILNYYSDCLGIWTQRTVVVRDGYLLVYGTDCSPYEYTPIRSYASLGRNTTPRRMPLHSSFLDLKSTTPIHQHDPANLTTPYYGEKAELIGCNSLGRLKDSGSIEFRLPLRHLNLMPSSLAPRAFCLSYRQNGNTAIPVAIFQALSQLDYERWVKTLAVEIMRQTPLDAIRFLDVLGIAAFSTPTVTTTDDANKVKNADNNNSVNAETKRKASHDSTSRWDRSPSSEGSTTSSDFVTNKPVEETPIRSKKANIVSQTRRKLQMSDVESQSDRDEVNTEIKTGSTGRKSRDKVRRFRDGFANESSSEDTRAPDEGIVMEERGSSSERSCRRALWSSDRSDILDSPRSISSYSSYEFCDSPEGVDVIDAPKSMIEDCCFKRPENRIRNDKKFIPIEKRVVETAKVVPLKNNSKEEVKVSSRSPIPLYRAQPFINEPSPEPEQSDRLTKKVEFNGSDRSIVSHVGQTTPLIILNDIKPWDPDSSKGTKLYNRARSCSPNNMSSRSPPRFPSSGRGARALSVGQSHLSVPENEVAVEKLKQRCQNPEKYVPVKEKLVLFESLCRAGRLARSSEELAGIGKTSCPTPRARSLHDLTRSRSPQVPVREMCKFFEKISNQPEVEKKEQKQTTAKKTEHAPLYEKYNSKCCNRDKYLKHKRNDCSNINKDSAFDKMIHRQIGVEAKRKPIYSSYTDIRSKPELDVDDEKSKYANFTQIRNGNKIITYV